MSSIFENDLKSYFFLLIAVMSTPVYAMPVELSCSPSWYNKFYKESVAVNFDPQSKSAKRLVGWQRGDSYGTRTPDEFNILPNLYEIYTYNHTVRHVIDRQDLSYSITFERGDNSLASPTEYTEHFSCEIGVKARI